MEKLLVLMALIILFSGVRCDGVKKQLKYDPIAVLAVNIPGGGVPGVDYPILPAVPYTDFSCYDFGYPGYFADTSKEARCQVYHICQEDYRHNSFLCPNGTLFSQKLSVCDWWFNVDCVPLTHAIFQSGTAGKVLKDSVPLPQQKHATTLTKAVLSEVYASPPSSVVLKSPATLYEVDEIRETPVPFTLYHQPENVHVTRASKTIQYSYKEPAGPIDPLTDLYQTPQIVPATKTYESTTYRQPENVPVTKATKTLQYSYKEPVGLKDPLTDLYQTPQIIPAIKTYESTKGVSSLDGKVVNKPHSITAYETPVSVHPVLKISDGFKLALDSQKPEYSKSDFIPSLPFHANKATPEVSGPYTTPKISEVYVTPDVHDSPTGYPSKPAVSEIYKAPSLADVHIPSDVYSAPQVTKVYSKPLQTLVVPITQSYIGPKIVSSVSGPYIAPTVASKGPSFTSLYETSDLKTPSYKAPVTQSNLYEPPVDALLMHVIIQESSSIEDDDSDSLEGLYETPKLSVTEHSVSQLYKTPRNPVSLTRGSSQYSLQKYSTVRKESRQPSALYEIPQDSYESDDDKPFIGSFPEPNYSSKLVIHDTSPSRLFQTPLFRDETLENPFRGTRYGQKRY